MGLSRLDNFLKSTRGTILYVDPNSLDATDSIENQGNSLTRPFKTIQRALIEAARFSYQRGLNNDRFNNTTILLYPGNHTVDNRPGFIPDGLNNYRLRDGSTSNDLPALDLTSNLDLSSSTNELYKLNSIHGGVILPRGTSLVGLDLRKTKIRPKYVPDPTNDNIERSAVFRVTGGCYLWQFSLFDGDPNGVVYKDYTTNTFVPNFSHHKLACFEYADGVNDVNINDIFQTYSTNRTDLDMYYEKVGLVYGQSSGRPIEPDYPSVGLDIQPKIDEFRIVGSTGESVGISSIKAGDGVTATNIITVTTSTVAAGLDVDTPFRIEDITADGYSGQFVVSEKVSSTEIKYQVQNAPINPLPTITGATLSLSSDTVTSASPYIFNISLRSVFGMCGMEADGSKATGFRSMVVAQFTGIGLQKDDNAFVKYNQNSPSTGNYDDNTVAGNETISNDSRARYKPSYKNFHVKVSNNSFIQAVSIFAIGFSEHFVTENGGDISLTNSNSNFGANALTSVGFRTDAFSQDNQGYITHIIPPKEVSLAESSIEFGSIDVTNTDRVAGVGSTGNLYLYEQTNAGVPPENVLEGFRVGAKDNDQLQVLISQAGDVTEYSARIVMPDNTTNPVYSAEKIFNVNRSIVGINSIGNYSSSGSANVITLTGAHNFINGESVRILSDTGQLPDGLSPNVVVFAITSGTGISANTDIKLAKTLNDAINDTPIVINEKGGSLKVSSRVSDKNSGDIGHPVQYDTTNSQWYVKVATAATENSIYPTIVSLGTTALGEATPRTFIKRRTDSRSGTDKTYRMRYVIPQDSGAVARPPIEGFIIQESNTSIGSTDGEIQTYFGSGSITNVNQQRNFRFISGATWDGSNASIDTELPHDLKIGSTVELNNIISSNNTTGAQNSGFNRRFSVTGISSAKNFTVGLTTDPGTFNNDIDTRTTALPSFKRKRYSNTYYVYRLSETQKYISGEQDGVYYVNVLNASNSPTVAPFTDEKFSQPVKELFPQTSRDNPVSDPESASCFATSNLIGLVETNDPRNSITKETVDKFNSDKAIGVGITDVFSVTGTAHTIHTSYDHGLNRVTKLSIVSGEEGAGYGNGSGVTENIYNAKLISIGSSVTGKHATAKLTVDGSGTITAVKVMDGGSAYGIGNTMNVVGVATTSGFTQAVVRVDNIYSNVGDSVRIVGVKSDSYSTYNQLYRITDVAVGSATTVTVSAASSISENKISNTTTGVGVTLTSGAYFYVTGESIDVNTFTYTGSVGVATITTINRHGLSVDRKVRITGAGQTQYNGSFVVTKVNSLTSFEAQLGVSTLSPTATGTIFALPEGFTSNDGNITIEDENLDGRMIPTYAGITTTISSSIANASTDQISIQGIATLDINIGDYLTVDDEMMRVKTTTTGSNPVYVFRGILGSKATAHTINSVIKKVRVEPIELRRHSIIRASGHTFEYVGYGPGNYSTAFPDKQDRAISVDEELLAQSTKREGGINFYTGMNDKGISYSGNKRLSTITGREEIFDTPVQTVEGEDIAELPGLNVIEPVEGVFARSIKVEGGPDNKVVSKFNGPLIVNNKITVNSPKGVESNVLFLQGDATVSRKYTVGIASPILSGNPGDIEYFSNPNEGGYVGWVYTVENAWRRFGNVSLSRDADINTFDQVGIATTSPGESTFQVGSGTSIVAVDNDGVGIGSTANGFKLRVVGESKFSGSVVATAFTGDGSGLTGLQNDSLFAGVAAGLGTGIHPVDNLNVGIGTTRPLDNVNLTVGAVGSSGTSLFVHGNTNISGVLTCSNVFVSGIMTATNFNINSSSGIINSGIITTGTLNVGTGGTVITTVDTVGFGSVGIGSTIPTATLDIGGHTKLKTYSENVEALTIVANAVTVDLSKAQSFTLAASDNVDEFVIQNPPTGSTSFTIKITQDSTGGRSVGIDTFKDSGGVTIPVYWPGGGVLPIVTLTADKTDIYSFKTFAGESITTAGLYGVVGGQNFA
jgi:hypothetical protein